MKKLTTSILILSLSIASYSQTRCVSKTNKNIRCKNIVKKGNLCHTHNPNHIKSSNKVTKICSGTTKKNTKCKNKTKNVSGLCHLHKRKNK